MDKLGGNMDSNNIYIQKGVRKVYYRDNEIDVEYITKFSIDVRDRNGYCIDSRGVDSFFYGIEDIDGCKMVECNKDRGINRHISLDELNRGYIKLSDFIRDGKFIGREFKRFLPVVTYCGTDKDRCEIRDGRYLEIDGYGYDSKYIVLYEKDNTFLVKYMYDNNIMYGIIDCRYIQDGMYKFVGPVYDEYKDRDMVYSEIVSQIDCYNKMDVKTRVKVI